MQKPADWMGKKIALITFLNPTDKRNSSGNILWDAKCDCGNFVIISPADVKRGHTKSCGCYIKTKRRKHSPRISSARRVWHGSYRECSFDIFLELSQKPCHYCGEQPSRTYNVSSSVAKTGKAYQSEEQRQDGNFTYNGLDRIDSSKEHSSDNIVPCCWLCNRMKNDLGADVFLLHIAKIHYHSVLRKM